MTSIARSHAFFAVLFFLTGTTQAFVPVNKNAPSMTVATTTSLGFGFLKELGLEKPSWLPDFGNKKDEEDIPAPAAMETEEEDSGDDDGAADGASEE